MHDKNLPTDAHTDMSSYARFMHRALELAQRAEQVGEVPVGAVVVLEGRIVGEGWNQVISLADPSAHAEVMALRAAARELKNYRLPGCELFVTIEPCTMCFGALIHSRINKVIYGAREPRAGMLDSNSQLSAASFFNHSLQWQGGILEHECSQLISEFFRRKRSGV